MALRTSLAPQPHLYIGDVTGLPLDYGMIYFGEPNKDPEFYPINVFYDEAMTVAAHQPIRTKGGFMNAFGDMVEVYADEQIYSIKVVDANGRKVFYKPEMSRTNSDVSVSTKQDFANSVTRTQADKNAETVSVEDFGASPSSLDNTTQINNAITYCKSSGATLIFPYEYAVANNLADLHAINTAGTGSIKRNGHKWYITPHRGETNYYYVAPNGLASNDGLSSDLPTTIANVNNAVRYSVGAKSGDGIWGLQMANGAYTDEGVRLIDWPVFKNPFRWYGATTTANADIEPLAIWQTKSTNKEPYAVLAQDISAYLNIDFKYIHFKDWSGNGATASAGAIVVWNDGRYNVDGCWFTNTPFGFTHRRSLARVKRCRFVGNNTAFAAGYQATSYVGDLATGGNKFLNCDTGAATGRGSIMYAQKNTFDGCKNDFECTRLSRMRPQGNIHKNWTGVVYLLQANSVLTPDNGGGHPDIFEGTLSRERPIYMALAGSYHAIAQAGSTIGVNSFSNKTYMLPAGTPEVLLSSQFSDSGYVPFRIPSWTLYSDTFKLHLELVLVLESGSAGGIRLLGNGSAASSEMYSLNIPNQTAFKFVKIEIDVMPYGTNQINSICRCPELGILNRRISTISSAMAGGTDSEILYRLYASNTGSGGISFISLRSYVEM